MQVQQIIVNVLISILDCMSIMIPELDLSSLTPQ